jgi:undecaprenyl-phosphate galactose phosphotransferase
LLIDHIAVVGAFVGMTVAESIRPFQQLPPGEMKSPIWHRLAILLALMASDSFCFALATFTLHLVQKPLAIALIRNPALAASTAATASPKVTIDAMLVIGLIFIVARYLVGDYSRRQLFWDSARETTRALLVAASVYLAIVSFSIPSNIPSSAAIWLGLLFLVPGGRHVVRHVLAYARIWCLPTAILGTSETAQEVFRTFRSDLALGLDVRWVVPENGDCLVPLAFKSLDPVVTAADRLVATLASIGCRQVILVPDDRLQFAQGYLIDELIGTGIRVAIVPSLRRLPLFGLRTSCLFGKDLLLFQVSNNLARVPLRVLKRTVDVIGSIVGLLFLSPAFLLFAYLIRREDGGPVFFLQQRVGMDGRSFRCWKFRSMTADAEIQMARWEQENPALLASYRKANYKLKEDPRVTKIGKWMRQRSLDELPQLINVFLGEMSLVGPRPLLWREVPEYGSAILLYQRVRPGITGLWQTSGRSHTTFMERVAYDEWYIKNWTLWYDLVIILQTFRVLVARDGAY